MGREFLLHIHPQSNCVGSVTSQVTPTRPWADTRCSFETPDNVQENRTSSFPAVAPQVATAQPTVPKQSVASVDLLIVGSVFAIIIIIVAVVYYSATNASPSSTKASSAASGETKKAAGGDAFSALMSSPVTSGGAAPSSGSAMNALQCPTAIPADTQVTPLSSDQRKDFVAGSVRWQ